jgi:hypothetical protein
MKGIVSNQQDTSTQANQAVHGTSNANSDCGTSPGQTKCGTTAACLINKSEAIPVTGRAGDEGFYIHLCNVFIVA